MSDLAKLRIGSIDPQMKDILVSIVSDVCITNPSMCSVLPNWLIEIMNIILEILQITKTFETGYLNLHDAFSIY